MTDPDVAACAADEPRTQLDREFARWTSGAHPLTEADPVRPCGPVEGPSAELAPVLHIDREPIQHGADLALLRDPSARTR